MQPTSSRSPRRSRAFRRWGPIGVVVVATVVLTLLAVAGGGGTHGHTATRPSSSGRPLTFDEARAQGKKLDWGPSCDTRTGRVKVPLLYAPPCVAPYDATRGNGGATAPGVTGDTITVAVYESQPDILQQALFQESGSDESVRAEEQTQQAYADFFQSHYEMYGRRVKLVFFKASGDDGDDDAARADAIKVATQIHAFASWGGPSQTTVYADELAKRGVLCLGDCLLAEPEQQALDQAPYTWLTFAAPDQASVHWAEFIGRELAGQRARWAGDTALARQTRRFGLIRYDDGNGTFDPAARRFVKRLGGLGVHLAADVPYPLDLTRAQDLARTAITKLKAAGVTSVIVAADPLSPKYFTEEATAQSYFPEWIVTGTVYTDSNLFGRLYDQRQWAHAFGVSLLPTPTRKEANDLYHVLVWQTGKPPPAKTWAQLVQAPLIFFTGVHLAGPDLTAKTFRDGLFGYPSAPGTSPTHVHLSWGRHGLWPETDYFGSDDATVVWWNPTATGEDEAGNRGTGMYEHADMGKRYLPGQWPRGAPRVFDPRSSVIVYEHPPSGDRAPDYPSPPRASPSR